MDDFANILERDYGLKPQGKMAPMSNVKSDPFSASTGKSAPAAGNPGNGTNRRSSLPILADDDPFFGGNGVRSSSSSGRHNAFGGSDPLGGGYDDVFGGPPKFAHSPPSKPTTSSSSNIFEDVFRPAAQKSSSVPSSKGPSSYPVFDVPVYDDDIFGGLPGIRSVDSAFEDVFNIGSAAPASAPAKSPASYDDLLGGFGRSETKETSINTKPSPIFDAPSKRESAFDDLLPGFGVADPAKPQSAEDGRPSQRKISKPVNGSSANILEDPFAVFDADNVLHTNHMSSASNMGFMENPTHRSGGISRNDASDGISASSVGFEKSSPPDRSELSKPFVAAENFVPKKSNSGPSQSPTRVTESAGSNDVRGDDIVKKDHKKAPSGRGKLDGSMSASSAESASAGSPLRRNKAMKSGETDDSVKRSRQTSQEPAVSPSRGREEASTQLPKVGKSGRVDDFWISIEDVKLVTQPTAAPPPVRPPPVPGSRQGRAQRRSASMKAEAHDARSSGNGGHFPSDSNGSADTVLDDLEAFASGSFRMMDADVKDDGASSPAEEEQGSAAATASGAAMKEAIERAEAKLRQAKEAKDRDKEEARGTRSREGKPAREREDGGETKAMRDKEEREREERDREAREKWRKDREREEREREKQREREKEREKEREREREREKDRANEIARQRAAVEKANAEVREREAQKAAERASEARMKAERVAVERATAEARERHERAAMEKAKAAERAAAEREKAEKDRAAAAAKEQQRGNGDDFESFFKSTSRPTSAPKQRTQATQDGFPAAQKSSEGSWRSTNSAHNVKKVPSMPSMADDLTSLFGGPSAPGTFQELEGETEDRRRARWERHQRTLERAAKALEEKHQRDLQSAKDQEERHRAGELVDAEIKRWAGGKEGNLRALLSTLQYVLWPECGWQAVSLTDLITAAAVKKVYRKATLYVHPDKVQQKGATNQQKYIAEKVFDLLKEAWNKFNSEELF